MIFLDIFSWAKEIAGETMSNRIEIEQSLLDIMNFFSQCLNYNAQLRTLNTEPVYFHPSLDGSYKKIPPFHSPVNFPPPFSSPLDCVEITGMPRFVILNPSPFVTLSETKGLGLRLRVNSVKNLVKSTS
jgi:hypothetical protein